MSERAHGLRWGRLAILLGALVSTGAATWLLMNGGPSAMPWTCLLHDLTGLHCPGCGMTRAANAVLEGNVAAAFRFNPLGVILLPLALVALVPEVLGWLRGCPPAWRFPLGKRGAWILAWLVIGFAVLRNLPFPPFNWLAPTS